jgi:hypothetical protein
MPKTNVTPITKEQYWALQRPVTLPPSPKQLFDYIIAQLVVKGLASYKDADPFRKQLPQGGLFLLVPPQPKKLDLNYLMSLIEVNGKKGRNLLDPQYLKDKIKVPEEPYLMLDIEDGKARLNTKLSVSRRNILREGRSPYTVWRGIIHAVVFPAVFQSPNMPRHNMDLVGSRGSRYESEGGHSKDRGVPYLCPIDYFGNEEPLLDAGGRFDDDANPEFGAPSCGSVIVGTR